MRSIFRKSHWGREVLWGGYLLIAALIVGLGAAPASALTLDPNLVLSGVPNSDFPNGGGTLAGDPFPWLTLEVHTVGTGGAVTISGTASTQSSWFFSGIYLNIAGLESTLSDALWSGSDLTCSGCLFSAFSVASNKWKADGDGYFDSIIGFATPNDSASSDNRFSGTDTFSLTLTCSGDPDCASFNENSFNALSSPTNAQGSGSSSVSGFRIAAHLQGLPSSSSCAQAGFTLTEGSCTSTWIAGTGVNTTTGIQSVPEGPAAVPEPAVVTLVGMGLVGVGLLSRRLKAQKA
jgi:hypothetical protein